MQTSVAKISDVSTAAVRPLAIPPQTKFSDELAAPRWLLPLRQWHLLSLDAPTVAAVWVLTFCSDGGARWVQAVALALAVWLLYVSDRVLDARRRDGSPLQARHEFHARHCRLFAVGGAFVALALLPMLAYLPPPVRTAWIWLVAPMLLYMAAVHVFSIRRVPKELVVAVMFAVAALLPALLSSHADRAKIVTAGALFAALCWLNCIAIARWEQVLPRHGDAHAGARTTTWGTLHFRRLCGLVAAVSAAIAVVAGLRVPALACALSAGLFWLLDCNRRRIDAVSLRAMVDAALLTPVLLWPFVR